MSLPWRLGEGSGPLKVQPSSSPPPRSGFLRWRSQFDDLFLRGLPDNVWGAKRDVSRDGSRGRQQAHHVSFHSPQIQALPGIAHGGSGAEVHGKGTGSYLCTSWHWGCGLAWCPAHPPPRSSEHGFCSPPPWSAGQGGGRSQRCARCRRGCLQEAGRRGQPGCRGRLPLPYRTGLLEPRQSCSLWLWEGHWKRRSY